MKFFTKERLANSIVILCLATFVLWYAFDAHRASNSLDNMILILPVAAITLCLCIYDFFLGANNTKEKKQKQESIATVMPVMILFSLYVLTLEYVGFDVGTVLFIALFLFFHGETKWMWIAGYSLVFGLLIAYFFSLMLPYPMPMLIFPTDY